MNAMIRWIVVAAGLFSIAAFAIPEGPAFPSTDWSAREAQNFAMVTQAPAEELANPDFLSRLTTQSLTNFSSLVARDVADPSWLLASSTPLDQLLAAVSNPAALSTTLQQVLNEAVVNPAGAVSLSLDSPFTPPCAAYALPCNGDPYRFAEAIGPDGSQLYTNEAVVTPVVFYDSECARLSGQVWRPKNVPAGAKLPGIVIQNGSIEASQTLYFWAAQLFVRNGYVVLSFDPRGQGRSDMETPAGDQGTNINPSVFWTGLVDAIDFFRSTPASPYPNNAACANAYPTPVTASNPAYAAIDPDRLGIVGHSLGAIGVSIVQGYGAPGADPWPGKLDQTNPVKVAVAWDGLLAPNGTKIGGAGGGGVLNLLQQLPITDQAYTAFVQLVFTRGAPQFGPRVPTMGQSSEYGLAPTPFLIPPDAELHKDGFNAWQAAGVPTFEFTVQGSTHYEWSLIPAFPASSWCASTATGACVGGVGQPMVQHYTLAWLDRWLKKSGETGYDDADARLLDDAGAQGRAKMSFYFRSARDFPDRNGAAHVCADIRAGCTDAAIASGDPGSGGVTNTASSSGSGGSFPPCLLAAFASLALRRRRYRS